jgi:hypothetical protein
VPLVVADATGGVYRASLRADVGCGRLECAEGYHRSKYIPSARQGKWSACSPVATNAIDRAFIREKAFDFSDLFWFDFIGFFSNLAAIPILQYSQTIDSIEQNHVHCHKTPRRFCGIHSPKHRFHWFLSP